MSETLYRYYERELLFIRQLANDFAQQYPAAAGSLLLEANRSVDPHVERLIESFAFLTARVQQKLDDDFPEMTEALLNVLYPHYLAPIPSLAIVQFDLDHANAQPGGITIPRHSPLHTQKIGEVACRFRTCYPVELWPIEVTYARLQSAPFPPGLQPPAGTTAVLRLHLECQAGFHFADLNLEQLRIHLAGDTQLVPKLYELIFNNCIRVEFRGIDSGVAQSPVVLEPSECLRQVGFERDQGLLPYPNQSFLGYRLLTEFFAFPEKFMFLDLGGWRRVAAAGFGSKVEVVLYLNQEFPSGELEISADSFRLGCTPVVNLFSQTAEPIPVTHTKSGYRVIPDVHYAHEMEVYSIDSVVSADPQSTTEYKPFYAIRHDSVWSQQGTAEAYWYASRRASIERGDEGTDVVLHLTDMNFDPNQPADAVLIVKTTCSNRDLPAKLQLTGDGLAFELETSIPLRRTRCLRAPTRSLRPPLRRCGHWRLVSHLCLNHLSLSDPIEGRAALQEILRLYDFSDSQSGRQLAAVNRQTIESLTGLSSRYTVGRVGGPIASGFCRGVEVTVELDEQKLIGTGAYLFASVLERFLGLYASINSFTQLIVKTKQAGGCLKKWPPRAGEVPLA
jgi:type VI secretion system protein ImpG